MRSIDALFAQRLLDGNDPVRPFSVEFIDGTEMRAITDALLRMGCKVSTPAFGLRVTVTPPLVRATRQPATDQKVPLIQVLEPERGDAHKR
jgi:hypothetical protein